MSGSLPSLKPATSAWSLSEQLNLAMAVVKSGEGNWGPISRAMSPLSGRPSDWYSSKNCASQYKLLLEQLDPNPGKGESPESLPEAVVRLLRNERIKEIEAIIEEETREILYIEKELEILKPGSGATKEQIDLIAMRVLKDASHKAGKQQDKPPSPAKEEEKETQDHLKEKQDKDNKVEEEDDLLQKEEATTEEKKKDEEESAHELTEHPISIADSPIKNEKESSVISNGSEVEVKVEVSLPEETLKVEEEESTKKEDLENVETENSASEPSEEIQVSEEEKKEESVQEEKKEDGPVSEEASSSSKGPDEERVPLEESSPIKMEVETPDEPQKESCKVSDLDEEDVRSPSPFRKTLNNDDDDDDDDDDDLNSSKSEETTDQTLTSPPQSPTEETKEDEEDKFSTEEPEKIVNVDIHSESSNISEEEKNSGSRELEKSGEDKGVATPTKETDDEKESSSLYPDTSSSKKNTSSAKEVDEDEGAQPLPQKDDAKQQQSEPESSEPEDVVKCKRSTRATIKKEIEASKSSGDDAEPEDSIKMTRRKVKRLSEKHEEDSSSANSSSSKRKPAIKVEEEPGDNVIENRRLSRVKEEILSGPTLTRSSRRGSSRSSSPTGSVILNEEGLESSEPRTRTSTRRKSGKGTPADSEHESVPPSPAPSEDEPSWRKSAFSALQEIKCNNPELLETPSDPLGIVKKPMDLPGIFKNLENGIYRTLSEFTRDVQLLVLNIVIVLPYSSEMYDQFQKVHVDVSQALASLHSSGSSAKPPTSSKRKRTSSVLSSSDASTPAGSLSSKSKRRKTRGDD